MVQSKVPTIFEAFGERHLVPATEVGRKLFGWKRSRTYQAARNGDLPTVRVGKRLYVRINDLTQLIEGEINE